MRSAASQTPNNIRKKIGPAVWLLALLWDSMPADWTGDTFLYVAGEFAERLEVSQRTIAKWRSRLRAAGMIGWLVMIGHGPEDFQGRWCSEVCGLVTGRFFVNGDGEVEQRLVNHGRV